MILLGLALLGIADAAVYLFRFRTSVGKSIWLSNAACFLVCVSHVAKALLGAGALIHGVSWWAAILAYAVPATAANGVVHGMAEKWKAKS
jgi:hypothetical protein